MGEGQVNCGDWDSRGRRSLCALERLYLSTSIVNLVLFSPNNFNAREICNTVSLRLRRILSPAYSSVLARGRHG